MYCCSIVQLALGASTLVPPFRVNRASYSAEPIRVIQEYILKLHFILYIQSKCEYLKRERRYSQSSERAPRSVKEIESTNNVLVYSEYLVHICQAVDVYTPVGGPYILVTSVPA